MTVCASKFDLRLCAALVLAVMAGWPTAAPATPPTREARATLIVYNARDPESRKLAEYYADRRSVPEEQIVGLDCPLEEEISRQDFAETLEKPLRDLFSRKGWWEKDTSSGEISGSKIRFVALMRGIPLKIRTTIVPAKPGDPPPPRPNGGDRIAGHDEASVDSELAVLGAFNKDPFGLVPNPYFRRFSPILDSAVAAGLLLVCRLDAPTPEIVRRMIDDGLAAEREGLYGWAYIDRRSIPESGYREGDDWLQIAAAECWNRGIPVILDNMPDIFPAGFPVKEAALYYGWYAWAVQGAMASPAFQRGAVAVHIHSFSAASLRDPNANWTAPLLARGAAASLGNVYEPYLDLTAHLDVLNDRLLNGFTMAESAYMSLKALSWMNTVVADPLYRPFAASQIATWRAESAPENKPWIALGEQLRKGARMGLAQSLYLAQLARDSQSGLDYEALGMLQSFQNEPREALASLESAGSFYKNPADSFRTVVERLRILQGLGDKRDALKLIDRQLQRAQPPDRAKLLTDIRNEISPPPTPPPSPATTR